MYSSRDSWDRLVTAVVRRHQIWELFHDHSRSPSISTIASDDDHDDFNQQFLEKGFCKLYKGELENGFIVAVKRFEQQGISRAQPLLKAEVETMRIAVHPNILGLVGVCITQNEKLLVYPFMVNITVGSCLRDRPKSQPPLDWPVRKRIALGAARGLSYMHDECESKIIHRDVKAANIYLNEDFDAIIGNFELAIPTDHGVTRVEKNVGGTFGHVAPEYLSDGICSVQSDVYSYGIFLLELVLWIWCLDEDVEPPRLLFFVVARARDLRAFECLMYALLDACVGLLCFARS
ncbi:hypothetical protein MIMGU_mgv11b020389mg [Erythranthe guttata]|uniref:non-specific serine/threonine protein kinase n=1 Tax=Erythranthe guttata TaxID=4155 RepID=A0A022S1V8_ERYGU|nr:hypothetical protein MIMGU_mgv11b020389mg [Erythranthe guttata]